MGPGIRQTEKTKLEKSTRLLYAPMAIESVVVPAEGRVLILGQDIKFENGALVVLAEDVLNKDSVITYYR